jgi:hypothetical protein
MKKRLLEELVEIWYDLRKSIDFEYYSADFWNKTDYGIAMSRKQDGNRVFINKGSISIQKVKFKNLGEQGIADHCYNFKNGRFEEDFQPNEPTVNESSAWDNHNWITAKNIDPFND